MSPEMIEAVKKLLSKPLPKEVADRLFIKFNENVKRELARALEDKRA